MTQKKVVSVMFAAVLSFGAAPALAQICAPAQPCGDVNDSQDVTIADALSVLRRSIDLPVSMTCSCDGDTNVVAGLLETGQTNCWPRNDATNPVPLVPCLDTGEDGEYREGVSLEYVDNGDRTITDNRTALMWEKLYNDNSVRNDYDNFSYLWEGAFKKIDDMNAENYAGYSDWRLPNIRELDSIVVYNRIGLVVDEVFGFDCDDPQIPCTEAQEDPCSCTLDADYWSSTTSEKTATGATQAWTINFKTGDRNTVAKNQYKYVRAVRGGQ